MEARRHRRGSVMFSVLLLAVTVGITEACMKIPQYFGTLKRSLEVGNSATLVRGRSSCACCAICHQEPSCASLSFDTDNNECRLYSTVGSYANLTRQGQGDDENMKFFIMPKRSRSGEFCRSNSDCQTHGDLCTAMVCTTNTTITCGTVYNQNSDLPSHRYWGVIEGHELLLNCRMEYGTGFTMLLASMMSTKWTVKNRLNYTDDEGQSSYPSHASLYSILWAADKFRDSEDGRFYKVLVMGSKLKENWKAGDGSKNAVRGVLFNASKTQSLLGTVAVDVDYSMPEGDVTIRGGKISFPYLGESGDILYHMSSDPNTLYGALIRSSAGPQFKWFNPLGKVWYINIHIGH